MTKFNSPSIAVLIDGGFFLKRYPVVIPGGRSHTPKQKADTLYTLAMGHAKDEHLYRIFYYDCMPFSKKITHLLTGKTIDFSQSKIYKERLEFFNLLKKKRKFALRMGTLREKGSWKIAPRKVEDLIRQKITVDDLNENDILYDFTQKGVDMKIGLDIASLSFQRQVQQIVLISGDSDFVPAAKMARRAGIDFILDPMWNHVAEDLHEHIDGLISTSPKPKKYKKI